MRPDAAPSRRAFLALSTAGACVLCSCAGGGAPPAAAKSTEPIDVGPVDRFARDGIYDDWAEAHGFFIVRRQNRLRALSAVCTHRRYDLESRGADIVCPKHGSVFLPTGQVTRGPALTPLPHFSIRLTPARTVVVDPGVRLGPAQSDDPAAGIVMS